MGKPVSEKKRGNCLFPILIMLCLAVMGFSLYKLISISLEYKQGEEEYEILQSYTIERDPQEDPAGKQDGADKSSGEEIPGTNSANSTASTGENDSSAAEAQAPLAVDFASLKAINSDLVCWLYIPVLDLSYPVVQGDDNDWYLHRTFEGAANFAGSLFVEAENQNPLEDPHTIIYGHSMKNQTMFGKLKLLLQNDLYLQNPVFWILTEEGETMYYMADICYTEAGSSVYTLFEEAGEDFLNYEKEIAAQSGIQNSYLPEITEDSRLVTLSTCAASEGTARLVVRGIANEF
ncbi:MAG: class B sortase [Lachnospiraceae bacterium]|nr:class B sortase [Lachnospiraceae bacterium]